MTPSRLVDPEDARFAATWEAVDRELGRRMSAAYASPGPWRARVRAALDACLHLLAEDEQVARLYLTDVFFAGEDLRRRRQEALDRLTAMIDRGRREPSAPDGLTPFIAEGIAGGLWFNVNCLIEAGRGAELRGLLPELMYLVVLPYLGREVALEELGDSPG